MPSPTLRHGVDEPASFSPAEVRQAARHHRRAIRALEGTAFQALSAERTDQLVSRLRRELRQLEAALPEAPAS